MKDLLIMSLFLGLLYLFPQRVERLPSSQAEQISSYSYTKKGKIITISDVHGDPEALINILIKAKVLDKEGRFIADNVDIVLLGDYADKGPDTRGVWDVLSYIIQQSKEYDSRVHPIIGNHDLLVLNGDISKMSKADLKKFKSFSSNPALGVKRALIHPKYRELMQEFKVMVKIGDNIFTHGGLGPWILDKSPEQMNIELKDFIKQRQRQIQSEVYNEEILPIEKPWFMKQWDYKAHSPLPNTPIWSRDMANKNLTEKEVTEILETLAAKRIIVGHTPTKSDEIEMLYDNRVILTDTRLSKVYGKDPLNYLKITKKNNLRIKDDIPRANRNSLLRRWRLTDENCQAMIQHF